MAKKITVAVALIIFFCLPQDLFAAEGQGFLKKIKDLSGKIFGANALDSRKAETKSAVKVGTSGGTSKAIAAPAKQKKEYTAPEMVEDIKKILDSEEEALGFIPGMAKEKDEKGSASYKYNGVKLEDLDKESLGIIHGRVRQEAARIRTDRMNMQLNNIRNTQQLGAVAGRTATGVPQPVPKPPKIHSVPKIPTQPPAVLRQVPKPPPSIPRTQ